MHDAFHPELYVAEKTGIFDCQDSKHPQTKKKKKDTPHGLLQNLSPQQEEGFTCWRKCQTLCGI